MPLLLSSVLGGRTIDFESLLRDIRSREGYAGQIRNLSVLPARAARYAELGLELHPTVQGILDGLGIERLYGHQVEAIEASLSGEDVVVVSGTASGKTLCYVVPLAQHIYERPTSRALLIYPTKALAQDQLRKLAEFGAGEAFHAATYDGDTPRNQRRRIKRECQVVLTNPDMLHLGILPYHHTWADFFRNLDYVVLDEVHTYRGVFGSHTANVIRRLRRIAAKYGANPRFVACSATIGNPGELFEELTGLPVRVIDEDGAPRGRRFFMMWDPPVVKRETGQRRSANLEAAELLCEMVRRGVRCIVFVLARRVAELILRYAREQLEEEGLADQVMAYRGGYLPAERREIERRLFDGELLGVISTTALEVGVDIGGLDAAILTGYPGSIASVWQQIGRAGRGQEDSLAALVTLPGGVHRYLLEHPEYLLGQEVERARLDPRNRYILAGHLACAAYEQPIEEADAALFGDEMEDILRILADPSARDDSHLPYVAKRTRWYWVDPDIYPAAEINLRSTAGQSYDIVLENGARLGTVDADSALRTVHEGAIYLHAGESYIVEGLDLDQRVATVRETRARYYTEPMIVSQMRVMDWREEGELPGGQTSRLGDLEITRQVTGFRKVRQMSEQEAGSEELDLPPETIETVGVCVAATGEDVASLLESGRDLMGSLHALEHALISLLPVFAHCDVRDIGGVSEAAHPDLLAPVVSVYDGHPGGVGIAEGAWERMVELLEATADNIAKCPCETGCPSCVQAPDCGSGNEPLDKAGALLLARLWLGQDG